MSLRSKFLKLINSSSHLEEILTMVVFRYLILICTVFRILIFHFLLMFSCEYYISNTQDSAWHISKHLEVCKNVVKHLVYNFCDHAVL